MTITKRSSNQLVVQTTLDWFLCLVLMGVFPIVLMVLPIVGLAPIQYILMWPFESESLTCSRVASDRVDCTYQKSTWLGLRPLPMQSFPRVVFAEYQVVELPPNSKCDVVRDHRFQLIFNDGRRQRIFEPPMQENCDTGDEAWILEQVAQLHRFFASETNTMTVQRENGSINGLIAGLGVEPNLLNFLLIIFFMFVTPFIFMVWLARQFYVTLCFDKTARKLTRRRTAMVYSWEDSLPLSQIRGITYTINLDSEDKEERYSAEIELSETQKISIAGSSPKRNATLRIAKAVASFLDMELRIDDDRPNKGSAEK